jgi:phosphoglycerate kinase
MEFFTLDDFNFNEKVVLLRVDINSPLDPNTFEIIDKTRIEAILPTLREVAEKGGKVVVLAHQGRPGKWDFKPLENHAKALSELLGKEVKWVDDIFGQKTKIAIESMKPGEVIMLKNVRTYEEEMAKKSPEEHSRCEMVQRLGAMSDYYINDAFAASHRSQASLVGFSYLMPAIAGRLMEKELKNLTKVFENPERPTLFFFGGAKFADAIGMIKKLKEKGIADHIALVGVAGEAFLAAKGANLGKTMEIIEGSFEDARDLIDEKIVLPIDFAYEENGARREVSIEDLPIDRMIYDIGTKSVNLFKGYIEKSKTAVVSGPAGKFEDELFMKGTKDLFEAITRSKCFSLAGGGHTLAALDKLGLKDKISYVSTGGGALEKFMLGEPLPVLEALEHSYEKFSS